jgi:hypothetical protein
MIIVAEFALRAVRIRYAQQIALRVMAELGDAPGRILDFIQMRTRVTQSGYHSGRICDRGQALLTVVGKA